MTRRFLMLISAGAIACGLATSAAAAPGDGIGRNCVASIEARAKRTGRPAKLFSHREPLCHCLEKRIKKDPDLSNDTKHKVAEFYRVGTEDPDAARKIQKSVPPAEGKLIGRHARACTKMVMIK